MFTIHLSVLVSLVVSCILLIGIVLYVYFLPLITSPSLNKECCIVLYCIVMHPKLSERARLVVPKLLLVRKPSGHWLTEFNLILRNAKSSESLLLEIRQYLSQLGYLAKILVFSKVIKMEIRTYSSRPKKLYRATINRKLFR